MFVCCEIYSLSAQGIVGVCCRIYSLSAQGLVGVCCRIYSLSAQGIVGACILWNLQSECTRPCWCML